MKKKKKVYEPENYCHVDEKFMELFAPEHKAFMKKVYYKMYSNRCKDLGIVRAPKADFFKNMNRRKLQFFQVCCPYCGNIGVIGYDKTAINLKKERMNYCFNCGKGAISYTLNEQLSRFIRLSNVIKLGLTDVSKDSWSKYGLGGNECYQMELVELTSIIEVVCRDCFEALVFIKNFGKKDEYFDKVLKSKTGNDFMNLDKANTHFKKALGIDLKAIIETDVWTDLNDIVELRNVIVHNNGTADKKFKNTAAYERLKDKFEDDICQLEETDLEHYFDSVQVATRTIVDTYYNIYVDYRNIAIANYYFNIHFA